MIIGSLLDAGLDFEALKKTLAGLNLGGYNLTIEKVIRSSITATKFSVVTDETGNQQDAQQNTQHGHTHSFQSRGLTEILKIINASRISESVKSKSCEIFRRLGEVEAGIHGVSIEEVHFHELGAIDTIVDIVGTVTALEILGIDRIHSSALAVGNGTVKTTHGILPVPAPATLKILADAGAPIADPPTSDKPTGELLTPTGAVLICSLSTDFRQPEMKIEKVGYGAGNKQFPTWPNVVRVWIGEETRNIENTEMVLIETNIDDMNPQIYGYLMEQLLTARAADVWFTPIQMKKNRPAVMVSVLGPMNAETRLTEIIMRETSTLGVRVKNVSRHTAQRELIEFNSSLGPAHVKIKHIGDFVSISPEYEDCRRIALERNLSLQDVLRVIESEARQKLVIAH